MRPIATTIIRDTEIQRIKDDLTRVNVIEGILQRHREYIKSERYLFSKSKNFSYIKERKKKAEVQVEQKNRRKTMLEPNEIMESISDNSLTTKNDLKKEEKEL